MHSFESPQLEGSYVGNFLYVVIGVIMNSLVTVIS